MFVESFNNQSKTKCECCGFCMTVDGEFNLDGLSEIYEAHLDETQECKQWHDSLPKLEDLCVILADEPKQAETGFENCTREQLEQALEITMNNLEMAQNFATADNDRRNAASGLHAAMRVLGYVVKDTH